MSLTLLYCSPSASVKKLNFKFSTLLFYYAVDPYNFEPLIDFQKSFRLTNENENKPKVDAKHDKNHKDPRQQDTKCLIQEKSIAFSEILGKGAFGYVRSAEWTTTSGEKVS